jgi:hypothetical protein
LFWFCRNYVMDYCHYYSYCNNDFFAILGRKRFLLCYFLNWLRDCRLYAFVCPYCN